MKIIKGQLVDIHSERIFKAAICIEDGRIIAIEKCKDAPETYIMPGFVDAHIHIESSMLCPTRFASIALRHGTVATISDPHEIANVLGIPGIEYMIADAKNAKLKIHFGAPSCVPATKFETAGAELDSKDIEQLMARPDIYYLAEVMNFPAVLHQDPEMMAKLLAAKKIGKPIDGHAPGMNEIDAKIYFGFGITTCHESITLAEAEGKIAAGSKILIREGSAAKNFDTLIPLLATHPTSLMFCSDDKHPDELQQGHINQLVVRSLALGYNIWNVLRAACINPIMHYKLDVGMLQVGDAADFIEVEDLKDFKVRSAWINGEQVFANGHIAELFFPTEHINHFETKKIDVSSIIVSAPMDVTEVSVRVIEALDGELITKSIIEKLRVIEGAISADLEHDILKILVVNRYKKTNPMVAFIKNFGLKDAAIASSVAHDSHNIVAVGSHDELLVKAINTVIDHRGGISFANKELIDILPLPIAGLMSDAPVEEVAAGYERLTALANAHGSRLDAPYMTLSFMALPVIPSLKLTDLCLFDVNNFEEVDLVVS